MFPPHSRSLPCSRIFFVREVFIGRDIFEKLSIIYRQSLTSRELSTSQNILNRKWKLIRSNCSLLRMSESLISCLHYHVCYVNRWTNFRQRQFWPLETETCTSFKCSRKACILPWKLISYVDFIPKSFIRISCYWMWFSLEYLLSNCLCGVSLYNRTTIKTKQSALVFFVSCCISRRPSGSQR